MEKNTVSKDPDINMDQIINRYLDLFKFVDLLRTNKLHLESAVSFDDNLEGTLPESIREDFQENLKGQPGNLKRIEDLEYENKLRT
jgi:hypothetical protein